MSKEITLAKAGLSNCEELYQLQTISFRQLLEKYQDYDSNPGAETKDRTLQRLKDRLRITILSAYPESISVRSASATSKLYAGSSSYSFFLNSRDTDMRSRLFYWLRHCIRRSKDGSLIQSARRQSSATCMRKWGIQRLGGWKRLRTGWILFIMPGILKEQGVAADSHEKPQEIIQHGKPTVIRK